MMERREIVSKKEREGGYEGERDGYRMGEREWVGGKKDEWKGMRKRNEIDRGREEVRWNEEEKEAGSRERAEKRYGGERKRNRKMEWE